jgi:hypothetical protein
MGSGSPGAITSFASGISGPTDVEAAADGSLWYTARNSNNVRRITFGTPTPTPTPTGGPTATPTPTRPPGNAPVPLIIEPRPGKKYRGGETIHFSGDCTDPEDGVVPDSGISWTVTFHHTDHTHGLQEFIGVREGDFTIPVEGEWDPIQWYRLGMFCTDSASQTASTMLDLFPLRSRVTLSSVPAGATLAANGVSAPAPHSFDAIVGAQRNLIATSPQVLSGTPHLFQSWSDGGVGGVGGSSAAGGTKLFGWNRRRHQGDYERPQRFGRCAGSEPKECLGLGAKTSGSETASKTGSYRRRQ